MLSRIAEVLFWMGRYLERAENTSRLLQVNSYAIAETPNIDDTAIHSPELWGRLLFMTGNANEFSQHYACTGEAEVIEWLAVSPTNPGSIWSSLTTARENARSVRFHLNVEMWEALNRAYNDIQAAGRNLSASDGLPEFCSTVRDTSHLFFGIAEATLPRSEGWHFLATGRYLERVDGVLRLLAVQYGDDPPAAMPVEKALADQRHRAFLRSVGAYEAYRKVRGADLESGYIADFLLLDETFPRSVRWSAERLHEALVALAALNPDIPQTAQRMAGWFAAQLAYLPGSTQVLRHERPGLSHLLAAVEEIGDEVDVRYFVQGAPTSSTPYRSNSSNSSDHHGARMKLLVSHLTEFLYPEPAHSSFNELWMCPVNDGRQHLLEFALDVTPETQVHKRRDYFGNVVHYVHIPGEHQQLTMRTQSAVETSPVSVPVSTTTFAELADAADEHFEFLMPTTRVPLDLNVLERLALPAPCPTDNVVTYVQELNALLQRTFVYAPHATGVDTPLADFLQSGAGVCQDYAHALLAALRSAGVPARYTSGYIPTGDGPGGSHAWVEAFVPGCGWIGLDATTGSTVSETYAKVAHGKDYDDCPPLQGMRWGGGHETLTVAVHVKVAGNQVQTQMQSQG